MKSLLLASTCGLAVALAVPVVQADTVPATAAAKCTKALMTQGKCSLVVARYAADLSGFTVSVSQRGSTRTATIVKADGILCKGGADPNGTPVDMVLRAAPLKLSSKGRYSGSFSGTTENNVPVKGTLHGTVSKKLATIRGTITGARNDPNEPPPLTCRATVSDDAPRA